MRRIRSMVFSKRFGAAFSLVAFLPTAVDAQALLPMLVAQAAVAQSAEPQDNESPQTASPEPLSEPGGIVDPVSTIPTMKRALPKPFTLAQATPPPAPPPNPTLNPDAQSLLNDANDFESNGDPVNAALSLFAIMERFPDSIESHVALMELTRYARLLLKGTFPEPVIVAFEQEMPTYDECQTTESKYVLTSYFSFRAQSALDQGRTDVAQTYFGRAYDAALRFIEEFPQNPLIIEVLPQLIGASHALGPDVESLTAQELASSLEGDTFSFHTWAIRAMLGDYHFAHGEKALQYAAFQGMLDQSNEAGIQELLGNPQIWPSIKAHVIYHLGRANLGLNEDAEALHYFQQVYDQYPNEGIMSELSALMRAEVINKLSPDAPDQAIQAFQQVIDRYPESQLTPPAMYFMAGVYSRWQNYDYAVNVLDTLAKQYPTALVAPRANQAITNILSELWDGTPIAREGEPNPLQFAQVCGPTALQHLLASQGKPSTVEELASLAGTDSRGTSMLALERVAAAKGVELQGVHAANLSDVSAPFIAFVNKNHFVFVETVEKDRLIVHDMDKAAEPVAVEKFIQTWSGEALVLKASSFTLAAVLDEEALARAVGGSDSPPLEITCAALAMGGVYCFEPDHPDDTKYDKPGCTGDNTDSGDDDEDGGCTSNVDKSDSTEKMDPDAPSASGSGSPANCDDPSAGSDGLFPKARVGHTSLNDRKMQGRHRAHRKISTPRHLRNLGSVVSQAAKRFQGITTSGFNSSIDPMGSALRTDQRDIFLQTVGGLYINFSRNFDTPKGLARSYYSAQDYPFKDNIGKSWTHSLNLHIMTPGANPPTSIALVDGSGTASLFVRDTSISDATWDFYKRGMTWIKRHKTNHNFLLDFASGYEYEFSAESAHNYARLEKIRDKTGNEVTYSYNNSSVDTGYLTKVSTPSSDGRYLLLEYSGNRITKASVKDSGGTTLKYVQYTYDSGGKLTKVSHDGESTGIVYGYTQPGSPASALYMSSITDRASTNYTFTFDYDGSTATKVIATYPSGLETRAQRSTLDGTVTIRDWDNQSTRVVMAKTVWLTDVNENITQKQYFANPTDTTPAATYKFTFDTNNRMTKLEVPGTTGAYGTFIYDSEGRMVTKYAGASSSDPTWIYAYAGTGPGASHSPTKITYPDGTSTSFYWDANKHPIKIVNPMHGASNGIRYYYDGAGNLDKVTDALGHDWIMLYDGMGNMTKAKNPLSQEVNMYYDKLNRVTKVTDPLSRDTFIEYSAGGGCSGCGMIGNVTKVRQAYSSGPVLYRDTQYQYNVNNQVTKVIDPQGHELDYFYDTQNRLTKTTYPSGAGGKSTTLVYNELNQVMQVTDAKGVVTTFAYDYRGTVTSATNSVGTITTAYDVFGNLTRVTDAGSRQWTYYYDAYNRMTKTADPSTKYMVYAYDKAGRVTKVGAGSAGTVQPITYTYSTGSSGTGLMTGVAYGAGGYADYTYDDMGRLSTLDDDWKEFASAPPLEYHYDAAGRLTKLYDGANDFLYAYNAAGEVTKTTDWGDRVTQYNFNDLHELTSLDYLDGTAYEKSWSFAYTASGQPDSVTAPNGMVTDYVYNGDGILTDLLHKDGSTVKQGFSYLYDDVYNITRITNEDSSYWTYAYDNRYRLTGAVRHNAADTIKATYSYTYDTGDNMISKVEPWTDDFSDGSIADDGLTASGTWSVVNKAAQNNASWAALYRTINDDDIEVRFNYTVDSYTAAAPAVYTYLRYNTTSGARLRVRFLLGQAELGYYNGSSWTTYTNTSATTSTGTKYTVRVEADGTHVRVWRSTAGGAEALLFDRTDAPTYDGSRLQFIVEQDTTASLDDIMILADDSGVNRTTTFTAATNNELSAMADYDGSTSYVFDDWGRLSTETRGSVTKTYGWTKANLLASVDSSDSADTDVSYTYTGDLKRLFRFENSSLKNSYQYGAGFGVVSETAWSGASPTGTKTYANGLAEVDVTGTPAYSYLTQDHLGSTRGMWDGSIVETGSWEFTPYGGPYNFAGSSGVTRLFTGHELDRVTSNYYAPFRTLNPTAAKWLSRDPLGMVSGTNMYGYTRDMPTRLTDRFGLWDELGNPENEIEFAGKLGMMCESAVNDVVGAVKDVMKDAKVIFASMMPDTAFLRVNAGPVWIMPEINVNRQLTVSGGIQAAWSSERLGWTAGVRWSDVLPDIGFLGPDGSVGASYYFVSIGVNGTGDFSLGATPGLQPSLNARLTLVRERWF